MGERETRPWGGRTRHHHVGDKDGPVRAGWLSDGRRVTGQRQIDVGGVRNRLQDQHDDTGWPLQASTRDCGMSGGTGGTSS